MGNRKGLPCEVPDRRERGAQSKGCPYIVEGRIPWK